MPLLGETQSQLTGRIILLTFAALDSFSVIEMFDSYCEVPRLGEAEFKSKFGLDPSSSYTR